MKTLTVRWTANGLVEMDYDGDEPVIADLTNDELNERINRAMDEGCMVHVLYPVVTLR